MTAPAKYLVKKIRKGKFVKFDRLPPLVLDEVLTVQQGERPGDSECTYSPGHAKGTLGTLPIG